MFQTRKRLLRFLEEAEQRQEKAEKIEEARQTREQETGERLRALSEQITELQQHATSHDVAIEDMLDEWSDFRDEQKEMADALKRYSEKDAQTAAARGDDLLKLVMKMYDQLFSLRLAASQSQDRTWSRQLELCTETADASLLQEGIMVFGRVGDSFQYDLHEAVSTRDAASPEDDMRIADVLSCGWNDQGKILRKAKVVVYRYQSSHSTSSEEGNR